MLFLLACLTTPDVLDTTADLPAELPAVAGAPKSARDGDSDGDGWGPAYDCDDADASVLPWHCATSADLVVDGRSVSMSGSYSARNVWIVNGGTVSVPAYQPFSGTGGSLSISASGVVYVDAGSAIDASAAGWPGGRTSESGWGPGGGGTFFADLETWAWGGTHGGAAGDICPTSYEGYWYGGCYARASDSAIGNASDGVAEMGSGGGGASRRPEGNLWRGGRGGGAITLVAAEVLHEGGLSASGQDSVGCGGAGAGGGIAIVTGELTCTGWLDAAGGHGNSCAFQSSSAGGGGVVEIYASTGTDTCSVSVSGGESATWGYTEGDAEDGLVYPAR